jgi:hypothetical protein
MDEFRRDAIGRSFAHGRGERHFGVVLDFGRQARVAGTDEGAQDPDVFGAFAEDTADAPHFEDVRAAAAAVAQCVHRAARFARFGARAGGPAPGLVAAGDGRLKRATLGCPSPLRPFQALAHRPSPFGLRRTSEARLLLFRQVLHDAGVFAFSTLCSLEFFVCAASEGLGRGFLKSFSDLNVARHCA